MFLSGLCSTVRKDERYNYRYTYLSSRRVTMHESFSFAFPGQSGVSAQSGGLPRPCKEHVDPSLLPRLYKIFEQDWGCVVLGCRNTTESNPFLFSSLRVAAPAQTREIRTAPCGAPAPATADHRDTLQTDKNKFAAGHCPNRIQRKLKNRCPDSYSVFHFKCTERVGSYFGGSAHTGKNHWPIFMYCQNMTQEAKEINLTLSQWSRPYTLHTTKFHIYRAPVVFVTRIFSEKK